MNDDGDVLAEERFEDFEEKSEAHQGPFSLFGVLSLEEFDESLEELLEISVELFTQVFCKCNCESVCSRKFINNYSPILISFTYSNSGCSDNVVALSNRPKSVVKTFSL